MKLLPESQCAKYFKVIQRLEDGERRRRIFTEEKRHKAASLDAKLARAGSGKVGNMRQVGSMDELDFWACVQKYGWEEVHSKEFLQYNFTKHPEHRVHKF